ncbi:PEGA domain-containing protein [Haliangium sp.]|uniref:PEGA domain-containing protein n=1 Tax=Haliangium sp. TaxID=2663208 RepID=UPI003D0C94B3
MNGCRHTALAVVIGIALAGWLAGPAAAQSAQDKREARALLKDGDRLIARGDRLLRRGRDRRATGAYERALSQYRRAYELVPRASIFFAIAGAEVKLGRYFDALEHYLRVADEVDDDELRDAALARIEGLSEHVVILTLTVAPPGAEISVDRKLRGQAPLTSPIYLPPGEHVITVTRSGYTPYEGTVTFAPGHQDHAVELDEVPVLVKKPKPVEELVEQSRPPPPPPIPDPPSKLPLFVGTSLALTLAAGATVTGLLALSEHADLNKPREAPDPDELRQIADDGRRLALLTDVLLGAAAVAGTYTLIHYAFLYSPDRAAYERARAGAVGARDGRGPALWVAPYVHTGGGGGAGGVAVGGRF